MWHLLHGLLSTFYERIPRYILECLFASLVLALIRGMFGSLEAGSGQRQCGGLPDPLQDFATGSWVVGDGEV